MNGQKMAAAVAAVILIVATLIAPDAPAAHADAPVMRVVVMPEAIAQATRELVPLDVTLRAGAGEPLSAIRLTGIVYCGADASNGASIIAVAQPTDQPAASPALSSSACAANLSDIAARLHAAVPSVRWFKVIRGHASWQPWRLTVIITEVATAGSAAGAPAGRAGDSWSYPTANLAILPPATRDVNAGATNLDGVRGIRFDLAVAFHRDYVLAALFSHGRSADPRPALTADGVLSREIRTAPTGTSAITDAQDTFVNELLNVYAPVYAIPINVQGAGQDITARDVSISGGDNRLKVAGQVVLGQLHYNAAANCVGEDLAVQDITLEAPAASCDNTDMMAQFKCQAQSAAMQASSNGLSSALTNYYQGQKFHYSTNDRPIHFNLGDVEFSATFEALKTSAAGSIVSEAGRAAIHRITPDAR